jgi:membrane protein
MPGREEGALMNGMARLAELRQKLGAISASRHRGPSAEQAPHEIERGREVEHPRQIPPRGWKDVLWRSWEDVNERNIFLAAGGVTYAVLVALFPALAALISIYGLVMNPSRIEQNFGSLSQALPPESQRLLLDEIHQLVSASNGKLGTAAIAGLVLALWSASRGMSGMITALDIAYGQTEHRGFFKFNGLALLLTLAMIVGGVVIIALVAVLPAVVQFIGINALIKWVLLLSEWPLLGVLMMFGLAILYRVAPDRAAAQWRWVSPGAAVATVLWILGSIAFSVYVSNFGSYDKTYGSLGGVVVLLTWLYLTAFFALLGAMINAQSERQTRRDSTIGPPKPMGMREAWAADTLGDSVVKLSAKG